jgi:putative endonuclease
MYYVYLLLSRKDLKFYIGFTEEVNRRVDDHNSGKVASTADRRPLELIYYEAYLDKADALGREKFLKSGSGHRFIKKQLNHYLEKHVAP